MNTAKQLTRRKRQEELLKLFDGDNYQEKQLNNQWYVKSWNGGTNRWQVAVYSIDSFNRYKIFNENKARLNHLLNKDD